MADSFADQTPHAPSPVDMDQLAMISDGDAEFEKVLIDSFIQSVGESLDRVESHMSGGQWDGCLRDAHKIKGASATLGATGLRQTATELEEACRDGATERAPALAGVLREEYEKVRACLQRRLDGER